MAQFSTAIDRKLQQRQGIVNQRRLTPLATATPRDGRVTRELVVILPDIVVVRDRVRSPQESEFLLHTWARPGASTEVDREARTLRVTEGPGHGWVKTLLPESAAIEQEHTGIEQLSLISGPKTRRSPVEPIVLPPLGSSPIE